MSRLPQLQSDRLVLHLAGTFAVLATALAMLGLYGVMANSVTRRTREIGTRMALGAGPRRILGMVMRELAWILGIGMAVGIPAALSVTKFAESQLYGVKPRDAAVVLLAALALGVTGPGGGNYAGAQGAHINRKRTAPRVAADTEAGGCEGRAGDSPGLPPYYRY
jgi:ABC-type lipoprotein release transport system permease subunit